MKVAKVNFNDCIGAQFFGGGITEQFVRYSVEGPNSFDPALTPVYPESVELHFFNCPGGEVYEGYGIYSYLRTLATQGVKVVAHVHGLCASIASVIVLAADERLIGPLGQIMTHKPMCDAGPWANADDHAKAALELNQLQTQIVNVYALRTGHPLDALHALMNAETFLMPAEAVATGFATGLLTETPAEAAPEAARAKVLNYAKPKTPAAMAITADEKKSFFNELKEDLKAFFTNEAPAPTPPPTNASIELAEGAGTLYTEGELAVGAMVYTDEALTVSAPDGPHALADGRSIAVTGGAVESITEAAAAAAVEAPAATNAADEALVAENTRLSEALAAATNTIKNLQAKNKTVPGSTGNPTPPGAAQNIADKAPAPATAERSAERSVFLRTLTK